MKKILLSGLVISSALFLANGFSHADKLKVKPEIFQPTTTKSQQLKQPLRSVQAGLKDLSSAKAINLSGLSSKEISSIKPPSKKRPMQIGINRSLSSVLPDKIDLKTLDWQKVNGGRAAHIIIQSNQAESLRLNLNVEKMPAGVEIRFFSPVDLNKSVTVFTADKIQASGQDFWSPSVAGDKIGIEIYLPESIPFNALDISIPKISHIFQDISKPLSKSTIPSIRAASESCNIDVACATQDWQDSAKSIAKYIYTLANGNSFLCSGTLLADTDTDSQIPYFLTANHCINDASVALSMEFYWFYRAEQCGGTSVSPNFVTTQGGGELLANSATTDFSFVKLINNPPAGVGMSGWSLDPLQANDEVVGLHHPNGDIKKYSKGAFQHFEKITDLGGGYLSVTPDDNGNFFNVVWSEGITAGGSSGSGLWRKEQGVNYLVGALFGGSSFCSSPQAPDDYGRFDRSYPAISQWLSPVPNQVNIKLTSANAPASGLKDGILIARYIQGLRGNALVDGLVPTGEDITAIENKLATLQPSLDIDLDGVVTDNYDAMIIIRYLLGLRGTSLNEGIIATGATRTDPQEIALYLDGFLLIN